MNKTTQVFFLHKAFSSTQDANILKDNLYNIHLTKTIINAVAENCKVLRKNKTHT